MSSTRSKPSMALATDTANPDRGSTEPVWLRWLPGSRLGRLIIALNMLGLAIVIVGALVFNELRQGLVVARIDSLTTQGELIATIIDQAATVGEPVPSMDPAYASQILQLLSNPRSQRARLFDKQGNLIADSYWVADRVEWKVLPPAKPRVDGGVDLQFKPARPPPKPVQSANRALRNEVAQALTGRHVAGMRMAEEGERVVSVSIPIQHVRAVLGVLTLEANDVDAIVGRQRAALFPFILLSIAVTFVSSLLLNTLIAKPVRRLADAADRVRLSKSRSISLPDIAQRNDELGDLTRALEAMTDAQSERIDAIERFAADVAHEIKNPLTSLRSAVETLDLVSEPKARDRLLGILKSDVQRLDRLVTDISNASRLDAELSREDPRTFDLGKLLGDIIQVYELTLRPGEIAVTFNSDDILLSIMVSGREGPLGQVFRNLIDNARSFSPTGGVVRVRLERGKGEAIVTIDDDGPGIPPDNLETVFERFYTSRPKGSAFGGNSGLGLSIARQIVAAQGGTLRAENRAEDGVTTAGARFVATLPEVKR
jgi:two-component system, OmpR family, sensor histidine kinase ChvG